MPQLSITADLIEGWLKEMGCTPNRLTAVDASVAFQFEVDYPAGTPHRISTIAFTGQPRALSIISQVALSPEHLQTFRDLEDEDKTSFLQELGSTLNREYVEFAYPPTSGPLECPSMFQLRAVRYDDGLSLDSFARSLSSVYKTEIAGIACVQRHLNPRGGGPGGHFQFKRTGTLQ